MIREYPPMITGRPEEQILQLRAYLVRMIGYIDEAFDSLPKPETSSDEWQTKTNNAIGSLRTAVSGMPLVQHGDVSGTTDVVFANAYVGEPAVFSTAGTISDVTAAGFTLTTTDSAKWIAVGNPRR